MYELTLMYEVDIEMTLNELFLQTLVSSSLSIDLVGISDYFLGTNPERHE